MKLHGEKIYKSSSSAKPLHANEVIIEEEDENNTDKECANCAPKNDNPSLCKCKFSCQYITGYYCVDFSVLETCTVSLLPLGSASEIGKKKKFSALFDIVYFSNRYICTY